MIELKIRKCDISDLVTLREIAYQTFDETFRHLNTPENMEAYLKKAFDLARLQEELSNQFSTFFFLFVEKQLAGYLKVNEDQAQTDLQDPKSLEIERIYVKKEFKGKGLGRILIDKGIEIAKENNKDYVWLGVWEKNQAAIAFYKKMGFREVDTHHFVMGEEKQTDFIMRKDLNQQETVSILGIEMDLGNFNRGAYSGPQAIRKAGLLNALETAGLIVNDLGNVKSVVSEHLNRDLRMKFSTNDLIVDFNCIEETVRKISLKNSFHLILGGDHSIAIGTIAGISSFYKNLGVIWFDAHADVNIPETSITGSVYGMPLAINLGYGHPLLLNIGGLTPKVKTENVVLIGTRDLDEGEKDFLKKNDLKVYSMKDIKQVGITKVVEEALAYLAKKCDGIHLSFDLDVLDPAIAPGVRTPIEKGLSLEDSLRALKIMGKSKLITSAEFVELNPQLDQAQKTARAAVSLIKELV